MKRSDISQKLLELVRPYVADPHCLEDVTEQSQLVRDLHVNSMHLMDIVIELEDAFGIEIEGDELQQLDRVGATLDLIERKLSAASPGL